jgi:hypothetical protein
MTRPASSQAVRSAQAGSTSRAGSGLALAARVAVAVSAVGLLTTTIGVLSDAKGFRSNSSTTTTLSQVCFMAFVLGAVAAVVAVVTALVRRRGQARPLLVLVGSYLAVAVTVIALTSLAN